MKPTEHTPITIVLVDDELGSRENLKSCLLACGHDLVILGEADSAIAGSTLIKQVRPDLVFLDIEMPGGSGFDLIKNLNEINFDVIFTTAYDHYALKAIKVAALDYLLKPITTQDIKETLSKFLEKTYPPQQANFDLMGWHIENNNTKIDRLAIPSLEGLDIVKVSDIVYCEADRNYTNFYLEQGENLLSSKTIKEYESLLPGDKFIRVHHKYLVNLNYVRKYLKGRGGSLLMVNGKHIDVSRNRKADLLKALK